MSLCWFVDVRENDGTEREAQGVGREMSCPRKLFLNQRKSRFLAEVCFLRRPRTALSRSQVLSGTLHEIFVFLSNIRPRLACMRTSRKIDFRWNKGFRSSKNNFRGHDISQGPGASLSVPSFSLGGCHFKMLLYFQMMKASTSTSHLEEALKLF